MMKPFFTVLKHFQSAVFIITVPLPKARGAGLQLPRC